MSSEFIYKVILVEHWQVTRPNGNYTGSQDDLRDGFIHLSTAQQLPQTLKNHYADIDELVLVCFRSDDLKAELKWEPSRGGDLFPHYYGTLPVSTAIWHRPIRLAADGCHQLPKDLL